MGLPAADNPIRAVRCGAVLWTIGIRRGAVRGGAARGCIVLRGVWGGGSLWGGLCRLWRCGGWAERVWLLGCLLDLEGKAGLGSEQKMTVQSLICVRGYGFTLGRMYAWTLCWLGLDDWPCVISDGPDWLAILASSPFLTSRMST